MWRAKARPRVSHQHTIANDYAPNLGLTWILISDFRLARLQQSREQKSIVLYVVLFGYLVTMVYFGIYQPRAALVSLLSLYTVFVGVILYFMLAMSDPFQGATAIDSAPLEYVLEAMRARMD